MCLDQRSSSGRPLATKQPVQNACTVLGCRTSGLTSNDFGKLHAGNLRILRNLILQDGTEFTKVWTKSSKSLISYESGRIYFENYRNCYSSLTAEPQVLYELPRRSKAEKIEDSLLCQCPLEKVLSQASQQKPFLLALTANNWLYCLSADTGETLQKVFGKSVVDVLLSQGVLAVSHSSKCVKLYSLEYIVKKFRTTELVLGQQCDLYGAKGTVGEVPYGIPVNIQIKECPPVLFEMSYLDNGIQIGGHPWHYIYTPNHKKHKGTHHICSIRDGTLAKNGVQDMKCDSLEADWIFFHPDDSGRIIHAGPSTINVLKIIEGKEVDTNYEVIRDFSIITSRDRSATSKVTVTSSGRTVKRRFQQLDDDPEQETFKMAKYEDELDLLAIVDVSPTAEDVGQASVRLYDNKSGGLMKRITLNEPWDVTYSHEVYLDRDTVIHIEQERNNSFCCHVYKMNRKSS
uniref:DDB1 and CUL4 associated factor 17 n=1 Tax=Astyanax mexicanus TaxID=7994 RepID=A0A8B9RNQ8_ASTMX